MTSNHWRHYVKRAARQFGFDVIRFKPDRSEAANVAAVLRHFGIRLVLDVGANTGQYAAMLRETGYAGRIASFEPLTSAHARLTANAQGDARWTVHPRAAIGDHDGEIVINVAGNNVSSSVLPMLDQHADAAPESRYIGKETVPLQSLDTAASAYLGDEPAIHLKIDTQGFEAAVLRGAVQTLGHCKTVQLELSLTPLYEGQELWQHFLRDFEARGFTLWTVLPGFVEAKTGRTLQLDAIFARP